MGVKVSQTKMTRFWNHVVSFLEWESQGESYSVDVHAVSTEFRGWTGGGSQINSVLYSVVIS